MFGAENITPLSLYKKVFNGGMVENTKPGVAKSLVVFMIGV